MTTLTTLRAALEELRYAYTCHGDNAYCEVGTDADLLSRVDVALNATAQPVEQPLSDEQIDAAWRSVDYTQPYDYFRIAIGRAVEQAIRSKQA